MISRLANSTMMAVTIPEVPFARLSGRNLSCKEIGGDFFDAVSTPQGLAVVLVHSPMPSVPMRTWTSPPATMPVSAATPPRRPSASALESTKAMSMPGMAMIPNTRRAKSQSVSMAASVPAHT